MSQLLEIVRRDSYVSNYLIRSQLMAVRSSFNPMHVYSGIDSCSQTQYQCWLWCYQN